MNTFAKTTPLARWFASAVLLAFISVGSVQAQGFGPLLPENVRISTTSSPVGPTRVAFDGTNYLVVFHNGSDGRLYGKRVSAVGAVLDDPGFVIYER